MTTQAQQREASARFYGFCQQRRRTPEQQAALLAGLREINRRGDLRLKQIKGDLPPSDPDARVPD